MTHLARIQQQFQEYLLHGTCDVEEHIVGTRDMPARARLGIYRNAYRARLAEALETNYPALAKLMGEQNFATLAQEYVAAHDSHSFSLRQYGHELAQWLAASEQYRSMPLLVELARWEWAMAEAFDAADAEPIGTRALACKLPGEWASMRMTFHPSVRILMLHWNAPQMWKAMLDEGVRPRAAVSREPTPWLLWRRDFKELFRRLSRMEAQALEIVWEGGSFGDVCAAVCDHVPEEYAPAKAAAFLRGWIDSGLITAVS